MVKYLHQASERGPVVEFSDAPLVVDGIRYYPAWPWSAQYRKCFREDHARGRMGVLRLGEIPRAYVKWLQAKRGFATATETKEYIRRVHGQTIY